MTYPPLNEDSYLNAQMEGLLPFARKVWACLPWRSRTMLSDPFQDIEVSRRMADSQLYATCYWLHELGEEVEARAPDPGDLTTVPGLLKALGDCIGLLPTEEQRSALRAFLAVTDPE